MGHVSIRKKIEIDMKKRTADNDEGFVLALVHECLSCLQSKTNSTIDERRKYVFYHTLMGRKFRQFWHAMRRGDRLIQEHITMQWIGAFCVLKSITILKHV